MGESKEHYAQWEMSDTNDLILYDYMYVKS